MCYSPSSETKKIVTDTTSLELTPVLISGVDGSSGGDSGRRSSTRPVRLNTSDAPCATAEVDANAQLSCPAPRSKHSTISAPAPGAIWNQISKVKGRNQAFGED